MFNQRHYFRATILALFSSFLSLAVFAAEDWPKTPPTEPPADWGSVSANFEEIEYPYPVKFLKLKRFKQDMLLAYMDVAPTGKANGQTVMIQHGMNFYSEAYEVVMRALSEEGFRVLAVDRIGYGKSSKPIIPYDFNFVAANMKALLDELGIKEVAVVGHSMGGMVVSRFAMMYDDMTTHVVMVNQIGLTDQRQSRPWRDPYVAELNPSSYRGILAGHRRYFPNDWPPAHLKYVKRQYGQTLSGEWQRLVMVRRLQGQMLYEDPVVYDWQHITTKALVMGGEKDGLVADFPGLANNVNDELQNSTILLYPNIGHAPHVEIPAQFNKDLVRFLKSDKNKPASDWK